MYQLTITYYWVIVVAYTHTVNIILGLNYCTKTILPYLITSRLIDEIKWLLRYYIMHFAFDLNRDALSNCCIHSN